MTTNFSIFIRTRIYPRCLLSVCFLFSIKCIAADNVALDHVIAVANENVIFASQVEDRLQAVIRQLQSSNSSTRPSRDVLREQIIEQLIVESIQMQLAERAGITVTNEELQNTISQIAAQNNTDFAGLKDKIERDGANFSDVVKSIEQEMIIQQLQQAAVSKRIDISDQDITNFLNSEEGKLMTATTYRLAHIVIPITDVSTDAEKTTAEQLAQKIYSSARNASANEFSRLAQQHSATQDAERGGDLGWRRKSDLPSIYADKVDLLAIGGISEPFLAGGGIHILKLVAKQGGSDRWVDQTLARHILVKPSIIRGEDETVQFLQGLRKQIIDGAEFTAIAKKYSEDYASALKGGDLGWTIPGQLAPQFQSAMDSTAINEISAPVSTQFGWHIIQVLDRRQEDMSTELLRKSAKNFLQKRRFEEELPVWLKQIRDEAYVEIKPPVSESP